MAERSWPRGGEEVGERERVEREEHVEENEEEKILRTCVSACTLCMICC